MTRKRLWMTAHGDVSVPICTDIQNIELIPRKNSRLHLLFLGIFKDIVMVFFNAGLYENPVFI